MQGEETLDVKSEDAGRCFVAANAFNIKGPVCDTQWPLMVRKHIANDVNLNATTGRLLVAALYLYFSILLYLCMLIGMFSCFGE